MVGNEKVCVCVDIVSCELQIPADCPNQGYVTGLRNRGTAGTGTAPLPHLELSAFIIQAKLKTETSHYDDCAPRFALLINSAMRQHLLASVPARARAYTHTPPLCKELEIFDLNILHHCTAVQRY